MNAQQILIEAQRLLRDVGWCKGFYSYRGSDNLALAYCATGAVIYVDPLRDKESDQAMDALRLSVGKAASIEAWNDDPLRTRSEVLNVFSEAIASLEEKSQ
jgi:hypothetical protein